MMADKMATDWLGLLPVVVVILQTKKRKSFNPYTDTLIDNSDFLKKKAFSNFLRKNRTLWKSSFIN